MDRWTALRTLAAAEVAAAADDRAGPGYAIRRVVRWYSKEFSTPLHVVEELPLDDVLQHYYESGYERLLETDEGRHEFREELAELAMSDVARREAAEKRDRAAAEEVNFQREVEAEVAAGAPPPASVMTPRMGAETQLPRAVVAPMKPAEEDVLEFATDVDLEADGLLFGSD